jgi:hypothetical protein
MQNRLEAIEYYSISADFLDLTEMVIDKNDIYRKFQWKEKWNRNNDDHINICRLQWLEWNGSIK